MKKKDTKEYYFHLPVELNDGLEGFGNSLKLIRLLCFIPNNRCLCVQKKIKCKPSWLIAFFFRYTSPGTPRKDDGIRGLMARTNKSNFSKQTFPNLFLTIRLSFLHVCAYFHTSNVVRAQKG